MTETTDFADFAEFFAFFLYGVSRSFWKQFGSLRVSGFVVFLPFCALLICCITEMGWNTDLFIKGFLLLLFVVIVFAFILCLFVMIRLKYPNAS